MFDQAKQWLLGRLSDPELAAEFESETRDFGETYQVFLDVPQVFAIEGGAAPEWIPFLPKPGAYKHPSYGDIDLTRESNEERVASVKNRVYQEHIPLDAEHQTKLSGAVGYIRDMKMNDDGSADAQIEWSTRGQKMVADGGFRYISPEWFRNWNDPSTGEAHKNVIAGGAITTRPFFKEKALRALVASERGVEILDREAMAFWANNATAGKKGFQPTGGSGGDSGGGDSGTSSDSGGFGATANKFATITAVASSVKGSEDGEPYWFRDFSPEQRKMLADSGKAMPDESFPIPDVDALKRAIQSIGRAKDPTAVKAHIKKRAAALDSSDLIPEEWSEKENRKMSDEQTFTAAEIDAKIEDARKAAVEEVTASFAEQLKTEKDEREAAQKEAEALKGSVVELQKQARSTRFTELVAGRGGANDGAPWAGDPGKHVAMLEALSTQFGEDNELFTAYIEQNNAAAQQLKEANLFTEVGTAQSAAVSDPERRLDQLTEERMKTHEGESHEQAYTEVLKSTEGRKLYASIPTIRGQ